MSNKEFEEVVLDVYDDKALVRALANIKKVDIVFDDGSDHFMMSFDLERAADLVLAITRAMAVAGGDK